MRKTSVDIESLGIPETAGYKIIIPNFAFVAVPDAPLTDHLEYLYVQCPIQPQIDEGLGMSASTMDFWFNYCNKEFPNSKAEMLKSFTLESTKIVTNCEFTSNTTKNIPLAIKQFIHGKALGEGSKHEVFGNGCNFDCSILQENMRVMYGVGELWDYAAPQNARTLKNRLNAEQRTEMDDMVKTTLTAFVNNLKGTLDNMELHHPLYDAAREALQISYCLKVLDQK